MLGNNYIINFFVEYRKFIITFYTLLLFILHGLNIFVIYYMSQKLNIKGYYNLYYFINEAVNLYTLSSNLYFLIKWTTDLLYYNITVTFVKAIIDIVFITVNMTSTSADKTVSYCMLGYCITKLLCVYIAPKMEYYFIRLSRPSRARRRSRSRKVHPSSENNDITVIISDFNYECKTHLEEDCINCLCSICLEEMNNKIVHNTQCNHIFHKECIVEYIKKDIFDIQICINTINGKKCPNCREKLKFELNSLI
jgi:hypothetical protein